jgi:RNA polymerase sigma factor (sigma-70 family)
MAKAGSGKNRAQEEWVVDEHTQSWFRALNEELQGLGGSDLAPVNLLLERLKNKQSMLDAKPKEERRFFLKGGLRKNRRQIHRDEQRHYRNRVDPAEMQTQNRHGLSRYEWQTVDCLRGVERPPGPAREVEARDTLNKALAPLKKHHRLILELWLCGTPQNEIARCLNTTDANVSQILRRVKRKFGAEEGS